MDNVTRDLLERALPVIKQMIQDCGGCDHSVGICMCEDIRLAEDIEAHLNQYPRVEHRKFNDPAPDWMVE